MVEVGGRGGGEKQAAASVKLMKALEMSARRRTFDILHHSQLVFSAEMSDQLAALPLTFNRKDGDTDAGGARLDGGMDGQMDSCVSACTDLLCFHLDPACSQWQHVEPLPNLGDLSIRCCSHPRPYHPHPPSTRRAHWPPLPSPTLVRLHLQALQV